VLVRISYRSDIEGPGPLVILDEIRCDEDQIFQISKRFSQLAGEESCDHARTMGRLSQEELKAGEHDLAGIGG
jgi:hypothetical protein